MAAIDEYLRHGAATARPRDHRVEAGAVHRHVDFPIGCALAVEQRLRPRAIGAEKFGIDFDRRHAAIPSRSEEHTSELQSLMRISYAVFCLKKKKSYNII